MKRTLHLTVVMLLAIIASVNRAYAQEEERVVLYESNFEEGKDGWTSINWGTDWNYDAESKTIKGRKSGSGTWSSTLSKTVSGNIIYKDIQIYINYSGSSTDFSCKFDSYNNSVALHWGMNEISGTARRIFIMATMCKTYSIGSGSANCELKSVKVTGIPVADLDTPDYTISEFSEIKNLPEDCTVEINFKDATVLNSYGTYILQDAHGGVVINDSTVVGSVPSNDMEMGMPAVVSGSIKGIHTKRNGASEIIFAYLYNMVLEEDKEPDYKPRVIFDDYRNHVGEFVAIPSVSEVFYWDRAHNWGGDRTEQKINSRNYLVTGISFPDGDNEQIRLLPIGLYSDFWMVFEDLENDYDFIGTKYVEIRRDLKKDQWYSLCLPFDYTDYNQGTIATFDGSEDGVLTFKTETSNKITAGTPVLFKPAKDIASMGAVVKVESDSPCYDTKGDYSFVGLLNPGVAESGSYYLTAGNTIKKFIPGSTMKALHAYFVPNKPSAALARAISIDGMTTAINDIEWGDGNPFLAPTDNRIYNLEGQMVGNDLEQLPKGIYIVNGKKVLK